MDYIKVELPHKRQSEILALGAQSKSSFCFVKHNLAYLSEPAGDLGDLDSFRFFENRIEMLKRKLKVKPKIIACDLHPEYASTKLANEWVKGGGWRVEAIQHHEAHVASCIVDNNIKARVIGVAFDGTGFGLDGNIWGGEFFVGTLKGLKRAAHLKYIPMPGGEVSIKEPWRMACSYLYNIYGTGFKRLSSDLLERLDKRKLELLVQIIDKNINSPLTSSMGRLFDAVSSLIGICDVAGYEGQAAVELEKLLDARCSILDTRNRYNFKYEDREGVIIIDWTSVIRGIVKDMQAKKDKAEISLKFHNAVCHMIKDVCNLLKKKYKINKVCMSGGVFQNKYLKENIRPILEEQGFEVYLHKNLPTHDGNIALGQAVIAAVQGLALDRGK